MAKKSELSSPTFKALVLSSDKTQRRNLEAQIEAAEAMNLRPSTGSPTFMATFPKLLAAMATHAKEARRPSDFARRFFFMLSSTLGLTNACLRRVGGSEPELRFVQFHCDKAAKEPRVFKIKVPEDGVNIIVNAVDTKTPVVDGEQLLNGKNHMNEDNKRDDGSIFSFPYVDDREKQWLFTSCRFGQKDVFNEGHLALLNMLFPIFCAYYNSIAFRNASIHLPDYSKHLDLNDNEELRGRLMETIEGLKEYDNSFLVLVDLLDDGQPDLNSASWELIDGKVGNMNTDARAAKEVIFNVALQSPDSSFVVSKVGTELHFTCRDGKPIEPCNVPRNWKADIHVAVLPIDVDLGETMAFVWVERQEKPNMDVLLKVDEKRNELVSDLDTLQGITERRSFGEETLNVQLDSAAKLDCEPVLIEGHFGTGKLWYARQIYDRTFGKPKPDDPKVPIGKYSELTPFNPPADVGELNSILSLPGVVVFYRVDEFSRPLQVELLRLVTGLELSDGRPLKAKMIFLRSTSNSSSHSDNASPNAVPGLFTRLKHSCVYVALKDLQSSREKIQGLVLRHLEKLPLSDNRKRRIHDDVLEDLVKCPWEGNLPELFQVLREMCRNAGDEPLLQIYHYPSWFLRPIQGMTLEVAQHAWFAWESLRRQHELDPDGKINIHDRAKRTMVDYEEKNLAKLKWTSTDPIRKNAGTAALARGFSLTFVRNVLKIDDELSEIYKYLANLQRPRKP